MQVYVATCSLPLWRMTDRYCGCDFHHAHASWYKVSFCVHVHLHTQITLPLILLSGAGWFMFIIAFGWLNNNYDDEGTDLS